MVFQTDKDEPTVEEAQKIKSDSNPEIDVDKYNPMIKVNFH